MGDPNLSIITSTTAESGQLTIIKNGPTRMALNAKVQLGVNALLCLASQIVSRLDSIRQFNRVVDATTLHNHCAEKDYFSFVLIH